MKLYKIWETTKATKQEWTVLKQWWILDRASVYVKIRNINTDEIREINSEYIVGGIVK